MDISFSGYNDEEIKALFGMNRKKVLYQNGADNLKDAYYGIRNENKFLLNRFQKKLLK